MATTGNLAIASFAWGRIEDARGNVFKDARLSPSRIESWDWGKTGTRHDPGIQLADLEDLLVDEPTTIILSRGVDLVLQVPDALVAQLRRLGPEVLVLQSERAAEAYNRLIATERVVALIHSTC